MKSTDTRCMTGQEIELMIDGYSSEGDGVGRWGGVVFFVPGALAGERVRARITATRKNHCRAAVISVIEASAARRTPRCPHFGACGGCRLQHMAYSEQIAFKKKRVQDAFERIGGLAGDIVQPLRGMEDPWHYRNKVTFTAAERGSGPLPGFHRNGGGEVISVTDCLIADHDSCGIARDAFALARETGRSRLDRITVRSSLASREHLVVIEAGGRQMLENGKTLAQTLMDKHPSVVGVVQAPAPRGNGGPDATALLGGVDRMTETLSHIAFWISATTFFQVNSKQAEALYTRAAEIASSHPGARVIDAYCGAGGFALFLSRRADFVLGIESVPAAVRNAAENARRNHIINTSFAVGDLEKGIDRWREEWGRASLLVVDPPRRGLSVRFIDSCIRSTIRHIIYASCDPATLARDCRTFHEKGFRLREVTPFDMFPQTPHVECLALLERG